MGFLKADTSGLISFYATLKVMPNRRSTRFFQSGFTLIEIMIVIVIISAIFVVIGSSYYGVQKSTRDAQRQTDLRTIQAALQRYYADHNYYPQGHIDLSTLTTLDSCTNTGIPGPCSADKVYLGTVPLNPGTTAPYCYLGQGSSSQTACDNTDPTSRCNYYRLYAQLEGASGTFTCGAVSTYSIEVTPNKF